MIGNIAELGDDCIIFLDYYDLLIYYKTNRRSMPCAPIAMETGECKPGPILLKLDSLALFGGISKIHAHARVS
jgi:hypothetical protein